MKQIRKLGIVLAVLVTGFVAALPFQRGDRSSGTTGKASPKDLVLRRHVKLQIGPRGNETQGVVRDRAAATPKVSKPAVIRSRPATRPARLSTQPPAPVLSDQFRRLDEGSASTRADAVSPRGSKQSGSARRHVLKVPAPRVPSDSVMVRHLIVDGDSLPELAERYLGDSRLHMELFEFNRDVLVSPDVLPIGQEIKVPFGAKSQQP